MDSLAIRVSRLFRSSLISPLGWCQHFGSQLWLSRVMPISSAFESSEQLVRILREGDNDAKFAASDVLWDLAGYRHSVSVIRESGAIPLLIELVRDGSFELRERISGAISQLSYNENDCEVFSSSGMIPKDSD